MFFGGKTPEFYWQNGFFWLKLGLFAMVFGLELAPMITFIRVRRTRAAGTALPRVDVERYRRINTTELALVVSIVFAAAFMARGVWLF